MTPRKVNKTIKSNIKCEHCFYAATDVCLEYWCILHRKAKNPWNRCKDFMWGEKEIEDK